MRSARRAFAALLTAVPVLGTAVGGLLLGAFGSATPAAAAGTQCVAVLVDGRLAGGSLRTGCATGDPGSGLAALTRAGFSYAFVPRQPGQVCQIDGLPQCGDTSTQTYWSYWWRAKGSSRWVYATEGAGTHDPRPGDTEAWVWQDGGKRQPPDVAFRTICPQAAAAPTRRASASPTGHSATATRTAHASTTAHPATSGSSATTAPARSRPPSATVATPGAAGASTTAPTPASTTPSTTAPVPAGSPATSPTGAGGDGTGPSWGGLAVGLLAIGGLAAAALARTRRRQP